MRHNHNEKVCIKWQIDIRLEIPILIRKAIRCHNKKGEQNPKYKFIDLLLSCLNVHYFLICNIFAGHPAAIALSGISCVTTDIVPTIT